MVFYLFCQGDEEQNSENAKISISSEELHNIPVRAPGGGGAYLTNGWV